MMSQRAASIGLVLLLFCLGLTARLMPHPPNLVPIAAIAMFSGFLFANRLLAISIPLAAMLLGDLVIGAYDWRVMSVVYLAIALPVVMSIPLRRDLTGIKVAVGTLASSLVFFVVTNFAVWYFSTLYDHTTTGLWECYVAAIPFFKNTLAGDVSWAVVLFGGYALATQSRSIKRRVLAPVRG